MEHARVTVIGFSVASICFVHLVAISATSRKEHTVVQRAVCTFFLSRPADRRGLSVAGVMELTRDCTADLNDLSVGTGLW